MMEFKLLFTVWLGLIVILIAICIVELYWLKRRINYAKENYNSNWIASHLTHYVKKGYVIGLACGITIYAIVMAISRIFALSLL